MRPKNKPLSMLSACYVACMAAVSPASAATVTWVDGTSFWDIAANWSSNPLLPGAGDDVVIAIDGLQTITHRTGNSTIHSLTNSETVQVTNGSSLFVIGGGTNTGTLRADGGTLNLFGGAWTNTGGMIEARNASVVQLNGTTITGGTLTTATGGVIRNISAATLIDLTNAGTYDGANGSVTGMAGTITNNGVLGLNGAATGTRLWISGDTTLTGSGLLTLSNSPNNVINALANAGDRLTNAAGHTIQGAGQIGQNAMTLTNQGLIVANQSNLLVIDPTDGANGVINTGTLRADGGTLRLDPGTFNNAGGTIAAINGSVVQLNSATITGGTLTTATGGVIRNISAATLIDLTNAGTYDGANGSVTGMAGTITNNGVLGLNGAGTGTRLWISGDTTLTGSGSLTLSNSLNNVINALATATDRLTNATGHTIQGAGQIGQNAMNLTNRGLIDANLGGVGAQPLVIDPTNAAVACPNCGVTNSNILQASNGGTLRLQDGTFTNFEGATSGTIRALNGSVVQLNGATIVGGVLNTAGSGVIRNISAATLIDLTNAGTYDGANGSVTGLVGTITNNGVLGLNGAGTGTRLWISGNTTLTGSGSLTLSNSPNNVINALANPTDRLSNAAGHTIQGAGQIGQNAMTLTNQGLIVATQSNLLVIDPTDGANGVINTGTLRADGGTLRLDPGTFNNTSGTIAAINGSVVQLNSATVVGGTLTTATGGVIRNISAATLIDLTNAGTYDGANGSVTGMAGTITNNGVLGLNGAATGTRLWISGNTTLTGSGSLTLSNSPNNVINALANAGDRLTNAAGHTIQGAGQIGQNVMTLTNQGLIVATQSNPLVVDTTNVANGLINGGTLRAVSGSTLTIIDGFSNSGTVHAAGGTVNAQGGFTGPTGTARIDAGGVLNIGAAGTVGILTHNGTTGGSLNLGANNLTVFSDYTNANFGSGNSFNRRANVSGTGQILAGGNAAQAITGANITNGNTANATLTIGNVRVGANTFEYQIANTGSSGPSLRGAIQTSVNGANLSDVRLSGSGVTAGNYNTGAPGSDTGNLGVTFNVASAGALAPLSGQVLNFRSNFDNIGDQKLNIVLAGTATAYNAAAGAATPTPTPVIIGNQRVGGSASQVLTVANTAAAGAFSEDLNATFGAATGAATNTGSISGRLAGTNNTGTGTMSVGVDTATAGAKSGTVTVNYQTAGAVNGVLNGLGTAGAGSQNINVSGNVYQIAQANPASLPATVNLGNFRAGAGAQSQTINITNTNVGAPAGFQEGLAASIGATTGTATGTGFANAAVGTSGALQVGLSGIAAGLNSGTVQVQLQSNGITTTGSNGLAALNLGGAQTITINGAGYNLAAGQIQTPALNFGNVQVGQSVSQVLTIRNAGTGPAGFVEDLNASFGATSGTNGSFINGAGAVTNLIAGNTSNAMTVNVNTSNAGTVNGAIAVNFASTGAVNSVSNGLGTTNLGAVNYDVTGTITANVIDTARPVINGVANPNPVNVNLGNVRIGSSANQNLNVLNQASGAPQQAALNASIASNGVPVLANGSFNGLTPGNTNNTSLNVGIDTSAAGVRSGSATVSLVSDITAFGNCVPNCTLSLPNQTVNVTGTVYNLANPVLNTPTVNLAARVGNASPSQVVSVTNQSADAFREGLNASISTASTGFTATGSVTNLAAQANSGSALNVALNTATAGTFSGAATLALASNGSLTNNSDLNLASQNVTLNGKVYTAAQATVQPSVNFGIVHVGDSVANRGVSVQNSAPVTALNDTLRAQIGGTAGPFSNNGSAVSGLAAGAVANNTALTVGLSTAAAGVFNGSANVALTSQNPDMADLGLGSQTVTLTAQVNKFANAVFDKVSGAGSITQNGGQFILDFGTVFQGSGNLSAILDVDNRVNGGPADLLDGSLNVTDGNDFTTLLNAAFQDVAADGSSGNLLSFLFNTNNLGSFQDSIDLTWAGHNASGYQDQNMLYTLLVRGNVIQTTGNVPEPASWLLFGVGLAGLLVRRRKLT